MGDFDCCTGRGECNAGREPARLTLERREPSRFRMPPPLDPALTAAIEEAHRALTEAADTQRATLPPPPPGYRWHEDVRISDADPYSDDITLTIVHQLRPIGGTTS